MEKTMLRRVMVGLTIVVIALVVFSAPVVREKIFQHQMETILLKAV